MLDWATKKQNFLVANTDKLLKCLLSRCRLGLRCSRQVTSSGFLSRTSPSQPTKSSSLNYLVFPSGESRTDVLKETEEVCRGVDAWKMSSIECFNRGIFKLFLRISAHSSEPPFFGLLNQILTNFMASSTNRRLSNFQSGLNLQKRSTTAKVFNFWSNLAWRCDEIKFHRRWQTFW